MTVTEVDPTTEDDLGAAAASGFGDDVDQPTLDGKATAAGPVVRFNGVKVTEIDEDDVEAWKVGQLVTFTGHGIVIHSGDALNQKDNTIRKEIVIKVDGTHVERRA